MAFQADLPSPIYGFIGRGSRRRQAEYLEAVKRAYVRDYRPLAAFFEAAVRKGLRQALKETPSRGG
jgi:hypothetical protein